jgi:Alpha 1,4-glycosyltransferase conserved region/Glycosyltransferase sugar-binding region containing DXD motif
VFQSFWWGQPLSPYEWLCLTSFLDMGHAVNLYTFQTDLRVPRGVAVRDAGEILPNDCFFVNQEGFGKGWPNAFSNLFRYKLLAERGGWWIDTDVVCLSRHIPIVEQFVARHDAVRVNTAVMFFQPNHPLMMSCFDRSLALGRSAKFAETGPQLITSLIEEFDVPVLPASVCYPVHFSEVADLLQPACTEALRSRIRDSILLHLYNAALRHDGVDKYLLPPAGSLLRLLVERHGVEGWTGEYDEQAVPKNDPMFVDVLRNAEAARRARDLECEP